MKAQTVRLGCVLAVASMMAPALTAQERGAGQPEAGRPEAGRPEAQAAPGRGNEANRGAVVGEMKDAEVRHRERLAMFARLRELAASKGQTERLAALDKLEAKEGARHARHLEKQSGRLSADERRQVDERLAKGREHARGRGKDDAKERAQPTERPKAAEPSAAEPKTERPAAETPKRPAAEPARPEAKPAEKPKERAGGQSDDKARPKEKEKERAPAPKAGRSSGGRQDSGQTAGRKPRAGARS